MKSLRILFILFVTSTLISQSAMDFFSALFTLQWLYLIWRDRKDPESPFKIRKTGLEWIFAAWILVVVIGFLLHPGDPFYALSRIVEFKWILIFYVMAELLEYLKISETSMNYFLGLLLFITSTSILIYYCDWGPFEHFRFGAKEDFLRAGGFFGSPMTFAHSYAMFFGVLLGFMLMNFKDWSRKRQILSAVVLLLSMWSLYLTFTRGVWIGVIGSLLVVPLIWRPKISLLMSLLFCGLLLGFYQISTGFKGRVDSAFKELNGVSERKLIWNGHLLIFEENPLFGLGYGQNTQRLQEYYTRLGTPPGTLIAHAHNQYLHLAAGTGVFGLLCYLAIWFYFFVVSWRLWKKKDLSHWEKGLVLGVFLAQTEFLIGSLTEANFEHSKVRYAVMILWAFVIDLGRRHQCLGWHYGASQRAVKAKGDL